MPGTALKLHRVNPMPASPLDGLLTLIWQHPAMQPALLEITDEAAFLKQVVRLAHAHGYPLTPALADRHLRAMRCAWIERTVPLLQPVARKTVPITPAELAGWRPVHFEARDGFPGLEWCRIEAPLREPFYSQSVQQALAHPFNHFFRRRVDAAGMVVLAAAYAEVRPSGLIYHLSRCGSTLISQMLAAVPEYHVVSEPEPLDEVLRAPFTGVAEREQWLGWILMALCRKDPGQSHAFIKMDCWHILQWRVLEQVLLQVPWVFLYRDPLEVMVSHQRHPGSQILAGAIEPEWFGWNEGEVGRLSFEEYGARVLAKISAAALEAVGNSSCGRLWNYTQLPEAVWTELPACFGFTLASQDAARMKAAAGQDAKAPGTAFAADSLSKQRAVTAPIQSAVARHVTELYQELEQVRRSRTSAAVAR